jgi:hypothetical protein
MVLRLIVGDKTLVFSTMLKEFQPSFRFNKKLAPGVTQHDLGYWNFTVRPYDAALDGLR